MAVEQSRVRRLDEQIARVLVDGGFVSDEAIKGAVKLVRESGISLRQALVSNNIISDQTYSTILSVQLNVPLVDLRQVQVDERAIRLVPEDVAYRYKVLPLGVEGNVLRVAMDNPQDTEAVDTLATITGYQVKARLPVEGTVTDLLRRYYKGTPKVAEQLDTILGIAKPEPKGAEAVELGPLSEAMPSAEVSARESILSESELSKAPIVKALDMVIEQAVQDRASDIHIEPLEDAVRVRYRLDGVLHQAAMLPKGVQSALISRIKVVSQMDIAEHRRPQDGHFSKKFGKENVDFRVASIDSAHGEKIVIRILNKGASVLSLEGLGFMGGSLETYKKLLDMPYGMIMVSGPTGSGKTTSMYASLLTMDTETENVVTVEDPVEYKFPGITQTQVNEQAGVTFAGGLRGLLRMDPDVILVGEVRDAETARTAVQSALTGHLVLTSIHANDAASAIVRIVDLGVEPYLVTAAVIGSVAQRLVRKICKYCKLTANATLEEAKAYETEMKEARSRFYVGKGCNICGRTGYQGRIGVYEIMVMTDTLRRVITEGGTAEQTREQAIKEGMVTMRQDGMMKARDGITTPMEVISNVFSIA